MFTNEIVNESGGISPRGAELLVDLIDVTKRYRERIAVERLSFTVDPGEVFGLGGANGGGKTTTLRILAGILKPDEGHGSVLGLDLVHDTNEISERVGYVSQRFSLYAELSVFENLRFRAEVYGLSRARTVAEAALSDFDLTQYARTAAKRLSGGWARRLQLAAALIHSPELVLLDEPTAGLDAVSRHELWCRIERLAHEKGGIVVSTHDLTEAERCTRVAVLSEGRVFALGTPDEIVANAHAASFLMSGVAVRLLAPSVEAVRGVLGSYPQGPSLRIVAKLEAQDNLHRIAHHHRATIISVPMRLADALLVTGGKA